MYQFAQNVTTWNDSEPDPIIKNSNGSIHEPYWVFSDRLWMGGNTLKSYNSSLDDQKVERVSSRYISIVTQVESNMVVFDDGFHLREQGSETWMPFTLSNPQPFAEKAIQGVENELVVIRAEYKMIDAIFYYSSGYMLDGTPTYSSVYMTGSTTIVPQGILTGVFGANILYFVYNDGSEHILCSSDAGRSWYSISMPCFCPSSVHITTEAAWLWDQTQNGIWKSIDGIAWTFHPAPLLPFRSVSRAFCTKYSCYAETDAGIYRIPRLSTSVADVKQQSRVSQSESELRAWSSGYLNIVDVSGRTVFSRTVSESEAIETSHLSAGLYFVVIGGGNGTTARTWMVSR